MTFDTTELKSDQPQNLTSGEDPRRATGPARQFGPPRKQARAQSTAHEGNGRPDCNVAGTELVTPTEVERMRPVQGDH